GTFEAWRAFFAIGIVKFGTFLFALSLFYHAWVGIRDLWMDYVQADGLRLFLHSVTALLLIGYAAWFSAILWRL
ncbi:MAG: succinate dehydrogenase, hydrophobic membrane anchor protein, partial [Zoogloeaceae bacterium]|nr:succinate dehydrogenase, hydrophobic membrane anchor protein [Zoogloeaceae bacterium]